MNCSQCGAELVSSATFCARCGTPRQNMAVPSFGVVPSMSSTPPVRSYTSPYLPAGVPPWPTRVPENFSRSVELAPAAPIATLVERPRRSVRGILTTAALLVLTVLLGVGLTYSVLYFSGQTQANAPQGALPALARATPSVQPTAGVGSTPATNSTATGGALPTPSSFLSMSSDGQKTLGITLKYPNTWAEEPIDKTAGDGSASIIFHPQQRLGIDMLITRLTAGGSNPISSTSQVNQGSISGLSSSSSVSNLRMVQPPNPHRSIGGSQWDEQDATFTANSSLYKVVSVTVKHGQYYYNVLYLSPNTYYNEANQKYIQPMLDSFKFS